MVLLGGVFFPTDRLPGALQTVSAALPLTHAIQLARPLVVGVAPAEPAFHVLVLLGYAAVAFYVALVLTRRRLLS
jgi:lipooligosaccharide transport system permease protein